MKKRRKSKEWYEIGYRGTLIPDQRYLHRYRTLREAMLDRSNGEIIVHVCKVILKAREKND